ncbi:MAG TPA: response regulator [Candidatus Mediterraneibacter excrementigallinarum]|nr:response regulator [Candidatus Mediterraneibacter excrementigallinarum]
MPKIIVADDEFYARKGLIRKIHMVDPDAVITGDFENGAEALRFIREHREEAEILLTDVKMPEMDGLELAQHIWEEETGTEIIIVSGFNEFEYAKKAISFGVSNYLIKPVQLDELREALEKITRKKEKYEKKVRETVRAQMARRAVEFLSIPEIVDHAEWRERFLTPVFERYCGTDYVMAVMQVEKDHARNEKVDGEIQKILDKENGCCFYFSRYHEYTMILFGMDQERFSREIIWNLLRKMNGKYDLRMTAGISLPHRKVQELKKAYQEAVYAVNQRLIDGWVKAYVYQKDNRPSNYFTKEMELMLRDAIVQQKEENAMEIVSFALEKCRDSYSLYITISGIFNLMYQIYCRSSRSEEKDAEHAYMLFSYRSDLYGFMTFREVEQYVKQIVKSMCQDQEEKKHHYIVAELLEYIEKNYQENINLSELAEHKYFMNNSYLSRLFKNEVGQTFSKYLMEFRIRKAAVLLENDLLKINDVAMLSGYNDVSHFIQYFKKFYGCTPEEFRNKRLEELQDV